jgi:uncharacterized protein CbrC (UPF0167 family)
MDDDGTGVRRVVAVILTLTAAAALVVGALSVSVRRTLYDPARIPELSRQLLDEPAVRVAIADKLTTRLTTVAPALRPEHEQIQQGAEALMSTEAFERTFADAVAALQRDLQGGGAPEVVLRLDGMLATLEEGLRAQGEIDMPDAPVTGVVVVERDRVETYRRLDDVTRTSGWPSIVIGVLAAAGAVFVAERRRRAALWVGATIAVAALIALGGLALAKGVAASQAGTSTGQDAISAIVDVVAADIRQALVVLMLAGLVSAVAGLALQAFRRDEPVEELVTD